MNRRAPTAIALLAVVGLVVSIITAWSQLHSGPSVSEVALGPRPAFVSDQSPAQTQGATQVQTPTKRLPERWLRAAAPERSGAAPSRAPKIGRSNASLDRLRGVAPHARPLRVQVGAIDIDARVRPVGVSADGQMQLPPDPRVFGWYRFGPSPDARQRGSVVIAGHLDSLSFGLGPLVRLRDARVGDTVRVTLSRGGSAAYEIVRIQRFERQGLPADIFSRSGPPRLRLVTCGGAYDADAGGYQQNLVVTAVPRSAA